jgi:DNA-binding IclR family transcriptional regulator
VKQESTAPAVEGQRADELTRYVAPALSRGLDVLELLAERPEGLAPPELAAALDLTVNQLFRTLQTLEQRGYTTREGGAERYRLTLRLFDLAHRHPPTAQLLAAALPLMRALAQASWQAVQLAVRDGVRMVVVAQAESPAPIGLNVRVGSHFPLLTSSAGLAVFACEPADVKARLLAMLGDVAAAAADRLKPRRLNRVLAEGLLEEPSPDVPSVTNLAAPVRNRFGQPIAALTLPFMAQPYSPMSRAEARVRLLHAVARLSEIAGGLVDEGRAGAAA